MWAAAYSCRTGLGGGLCPARVENLKPQLSSRPNSGTAKRSSAVKHSFRSVRTMAAVPDSEKPVLLFDVMDTLVYDPFFEHMGPHFGMTFKELLAAKHPTTWLEFERGEVSEDVAFERFWADGRAVDAAALKNMMMEQYRYLPGVQGMLESLKAQGYDMHVVSNYPVWYTMIEDKLKLSQYLPWTFISCEGPMKGKRKPDTDVYHIITEHLGIDASQAVFIDDRPGNVEAAQQVGMKGVCVDKKASFDQLANSLRSLGIEL